MIEVKFEIEKDELKDGRYKVCVYEIQGEFKQLIGTPLRDATEKFAKDIVYNIKYGFEYGFRFFRKKLVEESLPQVDSLLVVVRGEPE